MFLMGFFKQSQATEQITSRWNSDRKTLAFSASQLGRYNSMNYSKCPKCHEDPMLLEDKIMGAWYHIIHTDKYCKSCSQPLALDLKSVSIYILISICGIVSLIPISVFFWRLCEIIDTVIPNINSGVAIFIICWILYFYSLNITIPFFYRKLYGKGFLRTKNG